MSEQRRRRVALDDRPEWLKWVAPSILAFSIVAAWLAAGTWVAMIVLVACLVSHLEGMTTGRRIGRHLARTGAPE